MVQLEASEFRVKVDSEMRITAKTVEEGEAIYKAVLFALDSCHVFHIEMGDKQGNRWILAFLPSQSLRIWC